jgi:hypothetical protein
MDYGEILDLIDAKLESESRLAGSERSSDAEQRTWTRNRQIVRIGRAGSTGIVVAALTDDRVVHERVFAMSPQSVERIARVVTEHLTEYVH